MSIKKLPTINDDIKFIKDKIKKYEYDVETLETIKWLFPNVVKFQHNHKTEYISRTVNNLVTNFYVSATQNNIEIWLYKKIQNTIRVYSNPPFFIYDKNNQWIVDMKNNNVPDEIINKITETVNEQKYPFSALKNQIDDIQSQDSNE